MVQPLRAVYEQGRLRLIDPVDLAEGQEIQLVIVSERERARMVLGDILVRDDSNVVLDETADEPALVTEIDAAMRGKPAISDAILDERREGP